MTDPDILMVEAVEKEKELEEKAEGEIAAKDEQLTKKEQDKEREIERGFRICYFKDKVFHIEKPTLEIRDKAAFEKSKEYTRLLTSGELLPLKKLQQRLKELGVWDDTNDAELENTRMKLFNATQKLELEKAKNKPNRAKLADFNKKIEEAKLEFLTKIAEKTLHEAHSLEAYTDKIETYVKLALCVHEVKEDVKTLLWNAPTIGEAIQKVRQEKDEALFAYINWQADSFWSGYSPDFLGDWQEVIAG